MEIDADAPPKGTLAIACHTASYMDEDVPSASRVPLLMTRDFLFANAGPLEGAVVAFAEGGDYQEIRQAAAEGYATPQKKDIKKVGGAFTNPAHKKWKK